MSDHRALARGDRRRNERLTRMRQIVPRDHAVLAIDLADKKQVFALTDHDHRVIARTTVKEHVWDLGPTIMWGQARALAAGFAGVTIACEPTGHRWKAVADLARDAGVDLVCVQPMLVKHAREAEDYTRDKSDDKDAMVIARLAVELHAYVPENSEPLWARLRHHGAHQSRMITMGSSAKQQVRDLLECAWPEILTVAKQPMRSMTVLAALTACDCDPGVIARWTLAEFTEAVTAAMPRWGGKRPYRPIVRTIYDTARAYTVRARGVGALERARYALNDMAYARCARERVEATMVEILDDLGLTGLATSIDGLSAVGAAAILAELGDPRRFDSPRAAVKHAGLCPRSNSSGTFTGATTISGRGRPRLRDAAWRAVIAILRNNTVYADRYKHLSTRKDNPLKPIQARVAIAATLLRQLAAVIMSGTPWTPEIARGDRPAPVKEAIDTAA